MLAVAGIGAWRRTASELLVFVDGLWIVAVVAAHDDDDDDEGRRRLLN